MGTGPTRTLRRRRVVKNIRVLGFGIIPGSLLPTICHTEGAGRRRRRRGSPPVTEITWCSISLFSVGGWRNLRCLFPWWQSCPSYTCLIDSADPHDSIPDRGVSLCLQATQQKKLPVQLPPPTPWTPSPSTVTLWWIWVVNGQQEAILRSGNIVMTSPSSFVTDPLTEWEGKLLRHVASLLRPFQVVGWK